MIAELGKRLAAKELSCTELTQAYLDAIAREDEKLNAYITVTPEAALAAAKRVDERILAGEQLRPLEGIPMTLKDNLSTKGIETTCASKILTGYKPIYDATVWTLLQEQNAVLLGKTNMDEFAMGSSCESSYFGGSANPHNLGHVAGGSSGGVASAVAGNLAAYGLGSDTGGSIRQPASFCGIVGLKPTYGAVSRNGLIAYASSLDQIGPITHSVEDAAWVFDAIAKQDPADSTSQGMPGAVTPFLGKDVDGMNIGVPRQFVDGTRGDVRTALEAALKTYEGMGANIEYFDMPVIGYVLPVYYILACAEAASNLGRYDGIRYGYHAQDYHSVHEMICKTRSEGFGAEVKRRIMLGNYVLSSGYYDAYYKKAQNLRGTIVAAFGDAFAKYDFLVSPTVPMTAFKRNDTTLSKVDEYLTDICTVSINIAGLPAVSVPCGFDGAGLPIGMQLIGKRFDEGILLAAAHAYEQATGEATHKTLELGVRL